MGMGVARAGLVTARVGTGLMYRVTAKSLFKKGLTYQGPSGLLTWKQDKDRIEFGMDVFRLGHYIHTRDPVEGSSSQTYQQNGGLSAPLVQKGKGSQPLTLPAAKPSAHGGGVRGQSPGERGVLQVTVGTDLAVFVSVPDYRPSGRQFLRNYN